MNFISFRADPELKKQLDRLAVLENKNKSVAYRDIVLIGIIEKKKNIAIEKYRKGEFSLGKAAELADLSTWEFLALLKEKKVTLNLTSQDVFEGADRL